MPGPSRSPTRARKILPFLLFLNQEGFTYPVPIRSDVFIVFAFAFRAREGAHALDENPERNGAERNSSPS